MTASKSHAGRRIVSILVAGGVALGVGAIAPSSASVAETPANQPAASPLDRPVSWLAFGDSYSSGEGIDDATDSCARSERAFSPLARQLLEDQRQWLIGTLEFVACTGDTTANLFGVKPDTTTTIVPGLDVFEPGHPGQAQLVRESGFAGRADVVTLSIGGNDIDFGGVARSCITSRTPSTWSDARSATPDRCPGVDGLSLEAGMRLRIDELLKPGGPWSETVQRLLDEFVDADGVLAVIGYPRIFAPSDHWGEWRNGRCSSFGAGDADAAGRAIEYLDERLRSAVERLDGPAIYISLIDLYDGGMTSQPGRSSSLCGGRTEWLNRFLTLGLASSELRYQRSLHPNDLGHARTAERLAQRLADFFPSSSIENTVPKPPTETPSTTPPIASGADFLNIGDRFEQHCAVAWPIAPLRSTTGIQMRMSCPEISNRYFFVDVFYPDPDLPVDSANLSMIVSGQIVDIAESEMGFRVLAVSADQIMFTN